MVTAVKINEEFVLFDASDPFSSPGLLSEKTLNWKGRIMVDEENSEEIELTPNNLSSSFINLSFEIDESGTITGNLRKQTNHYLAARWRKMHGKFNKNEYLEFLEDYYDGIKIKNHEFEGLKNYGETLTETFTFEMNNACTQIGNKFYVNPLLFLALKEHDFTDEERHYPIDFSFPKNERYMISIHIPEGFNFEWVPEAAAMSMNNDLGDFRYQLSSSQNQLQLNVLKSIKTTFIHQDYYPYLKEFFDQMQLKETEEILISKELASDQALNQDE